jgi:hypothetical protein
MSSRATLANETRMVSGEVRLRLLPQLVVVLALDDLAAYAVSRIDRCVCHQPIVAGVTPTSPV